MSQKKLQVALRGIALAATLYLAVPAVAVAQDAYAFKILHAFGAAGDGIGPYSGVIFDKQGNLYGETLTGGNTSCSYGCGTVYELSPQKDGSWTETILYSFTGAGDGYEPNGGLAMDASGHLYGVTRNGGANNRGTVFELAPGSRGWTETVLYGFCSLPSCADGADPFCGPVLDPAGNLYGTTSGHQGVTYELSPGPSGWTETVLYTLCSQPNCSDGDFPEGLVRDAAGNLYGPAEEGGNTGAGVVFSLRQQPGGGWTYVKLHDFAGNKLGDGPTAVTLHEGALYGNTVGCGVTSCGTIYDLTASGRKIQANLLYVFTNTTEGATPDGNLAFDRAGNMFGATGDGGTGCGGGCGVVFEMTPGSGGTWQYQVLHDFDGQDGELPGYGVTTDGRGHLYGTTLGGGAPYYGGVVFEISVPTEATK